MIDIEKIYRFKCPKWDELPNEGKLSATLVEELNELLSPIFFDEPVITKTMIQNYSKWGLIPRVSGRKYKREHIALLIIISISKHVLDIKELKNGFKLQLMRMDMEDGYNAFVECLNTAIENTFSSTLKKGVIEFKALTADENKEGVQLLANVFAQRMLTRIIIIKEGYRRVVEKID